MLEIIGEGEGSRTLFFQSYTKQSSTGLLDFPTYLSEGCSITLPEKYPIFISRRIGGAILSQLLSLGLPVYCSASSGRPLRS